jgi:hypothetical protein
MGGFHAWKNARESDRAVSRRVGGRSWFAAANSLVIAASLLATPARAQQPDWEAVAEVPVIEILTTDADGDLRETKVWFVLIDGQPYLRTNASRWLENLRRDSDCALRIEGREYRARAEEVPGDTLVEAVDRASREKYGWQERMIHVFRMRTPQILRIHPRLTGE